MYPLFVIPEHDRSLFLVHALHNRQGLHPDPLGAQQISSYLEALLNYNAGAHQLPGIRLTQGTHTLKARTTSGAGEITITYQEGSL